MDEKDFVIDKWKKCAKDVCDEFEGYNTERWKSVVSSLENRIDGKYGTDEYKLSGILFESEFFVFASETAFLMCVFKDLFDESKELAGRYDKLSDEYREMCNDYHKMCGEYRELCSKKDDFIKGYKNICNRYNELCDEKSEKLQDAYKELLDAIHDESLSNDVVSN